MGTLSKSPTPQKDSSGNPFSTVKSSTPSPSTSVNANALAPVTNRIYTLHEFDPDKIVTGQINPNQIDPLLYKSFSSSSNGTVIIDKNKDLTNQKTLINLNVSKTSNIKFNQVIDSVIQEFTEDLDSTIAFLENKVASLESGTQRSRADKAALAAQIAELNAQIASLRDQLVLAVDPGRNNIVSDTLMYGSELVSIETGILGRPVKNILLSRNRMAKGIIQRNGAFKITTGTYNTNGMPLGPETVIWEKGKDGKQDIYPSRFMVFKLGSILETVRVDYNNTATPYIRTWSIGDSISPKAKLQLTDSGILNLFDGDRVIWSSYGQPAFDPPGAVTAPATPAASTGTQGSSGSTGAVTSATVAATVAAARAAAAAAAGSGPVAAATAASALAAALAAGAPATTPPGETVTVNWKLNLENWSASDTFKIEVGDKYETLTTKLNINNITADDVRYIYNVITGTGNNARASFTVKPGFWLRVTRSISSNYTKKQSIKIRRDGEEINEQKQAKRKTNETLVLTKGPNLSGSTFDIESLDARD